MESNVKPKLIDSDMERIIHQAFGSRVVETKELTDGWANSAYTIVTSDGRNVILKVAPFKGTKMMRYEANLMRTEVEALRLFDNSGTLPVPKVLAYDDTCTLINAEYFIMERLSGVPYNKIKETLSQEEKDAIEFELGVYSRLINEVQGEKFGYFLQQESWNDSWAEAFQQMIRGVLADGRDAGVELPAGDAVIESEIERHLDALHEVVSAPSRALGFMGWKCVCREWENNRADRFRKSALGRPADGGLFRPLQPYRRVLKGLWAGRRNPKSAAAQSDVRFLSGSDLMD